VCESGRSKTSESIVPGSKFVADSERAGIDMCAGRATGYKKGFCLCMKCLELLVYD
jgi:hypothetical protein